MSIRLPTGTTPAGIFEIFTGFALLPMSMLTAGLTVMSRALSALGPPPTAEPGHLFTPEVAPRWAAATFDDQRFEVTAANVGPPPTSGAPRGAVKSPSTKEDRSMSCSCGSDYCSCPPNVVCPPVVSDKSLGGRCCVKVVQYTVISARSGINDNNRIIVDPTTIAFSDDMTDADFTAWVISEHCDEINRKVPRGDRKYLRVAYQVFARFAEEQRNLEQEQVAVLRDIARKLPGPGGEKHDDKDDSKPVRAKAGA